MKLKEVKAYVSLGILDVASSLMKGGISWYEIKGGESICVIGHFGCGIIIDERR